MIVMFSTPKRQLWIRACLARPVWRRAALLGLTIGLLQAVVHQGEHWMHHEFSPSVIAKSLSSPLITFAVAFLSGAAAWVERQSPPETNPPKL
jgi:type III secretory pathway component EscS